MKKHGIGSRLLSLLLVLAMVMSFAPVSVFAAVGDIATDEKTGDTGLSKDINTQDTISWPIKIYDFLNDGMLFEFANAGYTGDISDAKGGAYGGGTPAPLFNSEATGVVNGADYTVDSGYAVTAYTSWLKTYSAFVHPARVEAVNFESPSHLHLVPDGTYDDMRPWVMSDYSTDNGTTYSPDAVRYAVVVYRTSGLEEGEAKLNLGWSTNLTGATKYSIYTAGTITYDYRGSVSLVANSEKWNYVVVDMKAGNLGTKWDSITNVYRVFADFHMNEPTDSVDISHVAYFDTEFEAIEFGKDCVAFDNDPGEYLNPHTEYYENKLEDVKNPRVGNNGMDFSDPASTLKTNGYNIDVYDSWTTATNTGLTWLGTVNGVTVNEVEDGARSYVQINNSNNSNNRSIYIWSWENNTVTILKYLRYVTIVYKTTGFTADDKIAFYAKNSAGGGTGMHHDVTEGAINGVKEAGKATLKASNDEWTYVTCDLVTLLNNDLGYVDTNTDQVGLYLPACLTGSASADKWLDIAMIDIRSTNTFNGQQAADYMNGKTTTITGPSQTTQKRWYTGNNVSFGMLYANQGGGWYSNGDDSPSYITGGNNSDPNGYFNYQIGAYKYNDDTTAKFNAIRDTAKNNGYPVSDTMWLLTGGLKSSPEGSTDSNGKTYYDMSKLNLGYTLYNQIYGGVMTAGLLQSGLITVKDQEGNTYRVPNYKEDTVGYIAYLLRDALAVGKTDASGNYNYNFVAGTKNGEQYGYADNAKTQPYDLASAIRARLGYSFPDGKNGGGKATYTAKIGTYAETLAKADKLIGEYLKVKDNITTFMDAAYYLLMNLYVEDSYNQTQDEYNYLVLSQATQDNGQTGYVFDAGFTTGNASDTANTDAYRASSQHAVKYDKEKGTISLTAATSKDQVYFQGGYTTTRFPFLPVTDATGVYAGETKSPYFLDDGNGVMGVTEEGATFVNRNYNYAMVSNGEFIYHAEDDLFFQFEGDDDVYLFINGELVLDIGAAHSITEVSMKVNDYVEWAKDVLANSSSTAAEIARAEKLNLVEGESYTFDFYYMERHGWGANCRIFTNIRVTDPTLKTDKTAYQSEEEVPYGGTVKGDQLVEYSFSMTNEGNSKLYNLDLKDGNIGVTLDHEQGLVTHGQPAIETIELSSDGNITISGFNGAVNMDGTGAKYTTDGTVTLENVAAGSHTLVIYQMNSDPYQDATATITYDGTSEKPVTLPGVRATNADGNKLDCSDLVITVDGYSSEDKANKLDTITVKVSSEDELIAFLRTLEDPNSQTASGDSSGLFGGAGLWRYATVTIRGIYYRLTNEQKEAGLFDNMVYTFATPSPTSTAVIKGQDVHRVYVTGAPTYYQWAGHNLFISDDQLKEDTIKASTTFGNQLTEYAGFFDAISNGSAYTTAFCDKFGSAYTYPEVTKGNGGYQVNYSDAGTYAFYLLMYLENTDITDLSALEKDEYAIVRVTVYVADVEDCFYVLDYGLTTEDLGTDGELFKSDNLFGADTSNKASLMGIAAGEPSYLDYTNHTTGYNRIDFSGLGEDERIQIDKSDGYFSTNLVIPKEITYNSVTKTYSLTEVGTNTITVKTPADWDTVNLYYWYDGGTSNGWPGTAMTKDMTGQFSLDIPGDVGKVIINNGNGDQTGDIMITPGLAATITVKDDGDKYWSYTTTTAVSNVTIYVEEVPDSWNNVYLYYWYEGSNTNNGWPGTAMTKGSDGVYSLSIPGNVDKVIINNGADEQTSDITLGAGKDTTITVGTEYSTSDDGSTKYYEATPTTTDRMRVIHVQVPNGWGDVYLYSWNSATHYGDWPGKAMNVGSDGWYTLEIPADMTYVIVNKGDNGKQTVDLSMRPDLETWITVTDKTVTIDDKAKYLAEVDYRAAITFTPTDFMDELYQIWMAVSVHDVNFTPSALSNGTIDITNEVQMYKTITVLPASVVYYEDDFPAIHYATVTEEGFETLANNITPIGSSSELTQSVDQEQEYGQDDAYKTNSEMSGNSQHKIEITDANKFASFEFKGTGFELIASTQADSYATIVVTVIDTDTNEAVQRVPVILQYDNGDNGGTEEIYQVPVIRVDGLDYGTYKVYINGAPAYDYSKGKDENGNYKAKASFLYLDGLRIYEPLGDIDAEESTYDDTYYDDDEKNVTFAELRDLIATGYVASAVHKGATLEISTGTTTWTEDLHPNDSNEDNDSDDSNEDTITANQVESVNDYLTKGPNNEVYINGSVENAALVFYVQETTPGTEGNLQIAVHGVDAGLFVGSDSVGMNADIRYGILYGSDYKWEPLTTVTSGTEQYYTINYRNCPYVDGKGYQVAIHVDNGMASFTSLKYNGLTFSEVIGEVTNLRYEDGILVKAETGEQVDAASYVDFQTVAYQMTEATVASAPGATEPTEPETQPSEPETQPTEPETTEPEATEPEATEPEATEPVETEPETTEPEESKPGQGNNKPGNGDSSGDNGKPENGNNNGKPGNNNSGNNGKPTESEKRENLRNSLMETIAYLMELLGKHYLIPMVRTTAPL